MKYKLMVSYNCGITYDIAYGCDERDDPGLQKLIQKYELEHLRYYVDGDDSVVCSKHLVALKIMGEGDSPIRTGGFQGSIEDKVKRLRNKFCK